MELQSILFWIVAVITGVCAVGVVVTQNIVRSATWLLFTLAGVSAVFFLLGADFVGATQLLVYVGGTLVLVVFGVMLTAQGPFINLRAGAAEWAVATLAGVLLFGVLATCITIWHPKNDEGTPRVMLYPDEKSVSSAVLGEAMLGLTEATPRGSLTGMSSSRAAPPRQQMHYLLPFEIVSVHLLVVLIGAAYLARAKRRRGAAVT
jgi:NADH-quinone oxidoreductase subunit J